MSDEEQESAISFSALCLVLSALRTPPLQAPPYSPVIAFKSNLRYPFAWHDVISE